MGHTPGPWKIGCEQNHSVDRWKKNCEWSHIRNGNGGLIAKVESVHPKGKRQSTDFDIEAANARLIAASPTMLTLCKGALAALSQNKTFPGDIDVAKAFLADAIAAAETL